MNDPVAAKLKELANPTLQTPKEKRSAIAKAQAEKADEHAVKGVLSFISGLNESFVTVWENPKGLSPQEVVSQWGDGAAKRFADHRAAVAFLISVHPDAAKLIATYDEELWTVTANEDGTVAITEK